MLDRPNTYAGVPLDRAALHRKDADWLAGAWASPAARILPVSRSRNFVCPPAETPRAVFVPAGSFQDAEPVFLGLLDGAPLFAVDLGAAEAPEEHPGLAGLGRFEDLRTVGPLMEAGEAALCAYARGMVWWNARHRFCGVCGAPAAGAEGGHQRVCTDPACATRHFPRTDPAVIMLVHDGGDRVVLGRNARFPTGLHSVLAGFVEPGDRVMLRYQAYPYQKFGHQHGRVERISRSALGPGELGNAQAAEPYYRVTVALARQAVVAYGREEPLRPGMLLDADILGERRRLVEWLLEPLYSLKGAG